MMLFFEKFKKLIFTASVKGASITATVATISLVNEWIRKLAEKRADDYLENAKPGTPPENKEHNGVLYVFGNPLRHPKIDWARTDGLNEEQKEARRRNNLPEIAPNSPTYDSLKNKRKY